MPLEMWLECVCSQKFSSAVARRETQTGDPDQLTVEGTPKQDIQQLTKAFATVSADMSTTGIASGHRVNWLMHMSRQR
ncbi:hypothetical protein M513_00947 [Trichuris suis]|uniref:Uncharacterized protein n=1 Tax=Trichuris suis TaxID=68888 RepID=A0A085MLT8_9BILA|nr:hypothetical protein M513_00947 [Trichuris suis]